MNNLQEQVEQVKRCIKNHIIAEPDIDTLLRAFLEECCGSFNETFLMNIMNQSPTTQKKMLDDQIRAPFPWLEEK